MKPATKSPVHNGSDATYAPDAPDALFTVERRETVAVVWEDVDGSGEPPLSIGYRIIAETIAATIKDNESQTYEFTFRGTTFRAIAEPAS